MPRVPDKDWISEALGATVEELQADLLGDELGLQSTTWRLQLRYTEPGSGPASLILKSETSDPEFQKLSKSSNAFGREVGVYRHCAPRLQGYRPVVHACEDADSAWLLLEDLSHLTPGDQVVGLTRAQTRSCIEGMAAIHAEFWLDPELERHSWLPSHVFWFSTPKQELVEGFLATHGVRFGAELSRLFRAVLEQTEAIDAALLQRPWTLVHGDLRADNLLFDGTPEDPAAAILDWSWACRSLGLIDVAFLLGGSTPVAQRQGALEELLQVWHRQLLDRGVRDYPLSEARRDLQLATLRCMTAGLAMHGFMAFPDTTVRTALFMAQAIQEHASLAMELEAWQALPEPNGFQT
jgi:hypothetical protein